MSDACEHDLSERETACADGLCPICLVSRVGLLEGRERVAVAERDALAERAGRLTTLLRDCMSMMDSLRDYVAEGGSSRMVGAREAIVEADALLNEVIDFLAAPPSTGGALSEPEQQSNTGD